MTIAKGIKEAPPDKEKDWTKDTTFTNFYRRLAGTDITSGFVSLPVDDKRAEFLGAFTDEFITLFYDPTKGYLNGTFLEKADIIRPLFEKYQALILEPN